jgi:hypothetical protein
MDTRKAGESFPSLRYKVNIIFCSTADAFFFSYAAYAGCKRSKRRRLQPGKNWGREFDEMHRGAPVQLLNGPAWEPFQNRFIKCARRKARL